MKTKIYLALVVMFFNSFCFAQPVKEAKEEWDELNQKIANLENTINEQGDKLKQAENTDQQTTKAQYENAISALRKGLEAGTEIEQLAPASLRLLAVKDLSETLSAINNPTSTSIGTPFTDLVVEAAAAHLLPQFQDKTVKQNASNKFKSILRAIYKGPIMQSLLNSNPISGTINAAIQQAGFFEKEKEIQLALTRDEVKSLSKDNPKITLRLTAGNVEGPPFGETEMKAFNDDLQKRIEFYSEINQFDNDQKAVTEELYIDAKLLYQSAKAGKSQICKLLELPTDDTSNSFENKFAKSPLTTNQMRTMLNDADFKKALSLSDFAKEQLPEVKAFNKTLIEKVVSSIEGYIRILNKYKAIDEARIDASSIDLQITKLNSIKQTLVKPI